MTEPFPARTPASMLADIATIARDVLSHISAGHDIADVRLATDLRTLRADADRLLDSIEIPPTTDERIAFTVRELVRQGQRQETTMSDISLLEAAVAKLGTDATADHDAILAAVSASQTATDALTAQVAALTAGSIDQATIDALTAGVEAADTAVNDTADAVAPVIAPAPTPTA